MATGELSAVDTSRDSWVHVTIKRVIQRRTDYFYVNRVFVAVCALRDGSESPWPYVTDCPWMNDHQVYLFVLAFVLSGHYFLPIFEGMDFVKLCHFPLKALRTKGLFPTPIIAQREGKLRANINDEL